MMWMPYIVMILVAAMAIFCIAFMSRIASNALAGSQAQLYQMVEFAKDALRSGRVMPQAEAEAGPTPWEVEQARKEALSAEADRREVL